MPGFLRTWGIPLLAGRDFDEHDIAGQANVMLISQSGARKVFGDENPIGKTLVRDERWRRRPKSSAWSAMCAPAK